MGSGSARVRGQALRWGLAGLTAMATLAGCSGDGDQPGDERPPSAAGKPKEAPRPVHDPPKKFGGAGIAMPMEAVSGRLTIGGTLNEDVPVALHKQYAFVAAPDNVQAVNALTGDTVRRIKPEGNPVGKVGAAGDDNAAQAPFIARSGNSAHLLVPFLVEVAGTGTQADHTALEVTASDADSAKTLWRLPVRLPDWVDESSDRLTALAVGVSGHTAIVRVSDDEHAVAYGIDLEARRRVWTKDDYRAEAVAGGNVVGVSIKDGVHQRAIGYNVTSGSEKWKGEDSYELTVRQAGPHLVTVLGRNYESGDGYYRVLDGRSGAVKRNLPSLGDSRCRYDAKETVVCGGQGNESTAYAMDAKSAKTLWQLPDKKADRIAPEVTAVWHGRVYGKTSKAAVVLEARSGDDVAVQPGLAPLMVNESVALALDENGNQLKAHPTAG